jgi:hypothetical protein
VRAVLQDVVAQRHLPVARERHPAAAVHRNHRRPAHLPGIRTRFYPASHHVTFLSHFVCFFLSLFTIYCFKSFP